MRDVAITGLQGSEPLIWGGNASRGSMTPDDLQQYLAASGPWIETGLSLVDQGYSPQLSVGGGIVRQVSAINVLHLALRRARRAGPVFFNAGLSGDTITNTLARFDTDVASRQPIPGTVVYTNGGNDINTVSTAADIETSLATMKANFDATYIKCRRIGAKMILQMLPDNGTWSARRNEVTGSAGTPYYRYMTFWRWCNYQRNFALRYGVQMACVAAAMSRPERQLHIAASSISVTSNVATATTAAAHGYATGDTVYNTEAADATWLLSAGAAITVTSSTTFTYTFVHANGSAAQAGSFVRGNTIAGLFSDSPNNIHYNRLGAHKVSHILYETISRSILDWLCFSEGDACNITGAGIASVTGLDVINRGMKQGTGGTKTGTAVSHTGNVATGWTSRVIGGNPTLVTLSQVARTVANDIDDPGRVQMQDQRIVIVASGANCEYSLDMDHALPAAWTALASKAVSNWVRPTIQTQYFYVNVAADSTTTGATEPVWPTTPGDVVTDGTCKWECRLGWINDGLTTYRVGAEYVIESQTATDALLSMSYGLWDESTSSNSIVDGTHSATNGGGYLTGENGFFAAPPANIPTDMTAPRMGLKLFVKANETVSLRVSRDSWYKESLTI